MTAEWVWTGFVRVGENAACREFGDALLQRPTKSGEDADAGIYGNALGRANPLVFPGVASSL
jgi:hypothetical protein